MSGAAYLDVSGEFWWMNGCRHRVKRTRSQGGNVEDSVWDGGLGQERDMAI